MNIVINIIKAILIIFFLIWTIYAIWRGSKNLSSEADVATMIIMVLVGISAIIIVVIG